MDPAYPSSWDKLYKKTFQNLRIGLARFDPHGLLLEADDGLVKLLNFPNLAALKKAYASDVWVNPDERSVFVNQLNHDREDNRWQVSFRQFGGNIIRVEMFTYAVRGPDGKVIYHEGMLQDISDHNPAEKNILHTAQVVASAAGERRFQALIENSADGVTVLNAKGFILYTSPSTAQITGLPPNVQQGKDFFQFVDPEDLPQVRKSFETSLSSPGQAVPIHYRSSRQDGSWRWIEGRVTNLLHEPAVEGIVLNYRDITEQRKTTRRLRAGEAELKYRTEFERLILSISTRLINVRTDLLISELEKALGEIGRFTRVDRCHIFLFAHDGRTMSCVAEWNQAGITGPFKEELQEISCNLSPLWLEKMKSFEVVYFNSVSEIPEEETQLRNLANWLEEKSIIDVPIFSTGRLVGYLALASVRGERKWSEEEIQLQKLLAEIIANALERQEAETRISQQLTNLAALHKIGKAITSKTEIGSVMNVVLEQVVLQLGIDAAVILLYDTKNNSLYFGSGRGFKPGRATTALRYLQNPLLEKVVAGREMIHMPIPKDWLDIWGNEGFTDYFGIPLVAKGEVNGVLELYRRQPFEPSEDWLAFMLMVAETAAIAIDNVSLFQKEQRAKRDLEQAYESTLESWARMLEMRDQETELHSKRVVDWTIRLARLMGLDGDMTIHLRHGALLHDIGKIFIPNEIFHKTGTLTLDEWNEIKKHPEYAYRLLSPIQFLRPALDIVYCHHEWWDGSGYPRALKGEQIPLSARIFTVVDVWDALTQDRPYRLPPERRWEKRRAMDYLRDQAGRKFDPRVVKAFLHLLESEYR